MPPRSPEEMLNERSLLSPLRFCPVIHRLVRRASRRSATRRSQSVRKTRQESEGAPIPLSAQCRVSGVSKFLSIQGPRQLQGGVAGLLLLQLTPRLQRTFVRLWVEREVDLIVQFRRPRSLGRARVLRLCLSQVRTMTMMIRHEDVGGPMMTDGRCLVTRSRYLLSSSNGWNTVATTGKGRLPRMPGAQGLQVTLLPRSLKLG